MCINDFLDLEQSGFKRLRECNLTDDEMDGSDLVIFANEFQNSVWCGAAVVVNSQQGVVVHAGGNERPWEGEECSCIFRTSSIVRIGDSCMLVGRCTISNFGAAIYDKLSNLSAEHWRLL